MPLVNTVGAGEILDPSPERNCLLPRTGKIHEHCLASALESSYTVNHNIH